jgi:hypothetical protein
MADEKKQKDELEDNINQDNPGDIHEADDTFGLPDINFDPIEPSSEEPVQEEPTYNEPEPVNEETPVDEPYMYASRPDEGAEQQDEFVYDSSKPEDENLSSVEAESEADQLATREYYHSAEEESLSGTDYSASMEEDHVHEEEKAAYVPGSYTPPHDTSNRTGVIVGVLLVLALAAIAGWYFFMFQPAQEREEQEAARQEQLEAEQAAQRVDNEEAARQRAAEEEAARQAELERQQAEATPETGTVETISSRTGRYYVVVASAVDGDLAMDYANKLIKEGYNVKIIQPYGNVIFHRVAVRDLDTWAEAQNVANDLKGQYDGVWVKKY